MFSTFGEPTRLFISGGSWSRIQIVRKCDNINAPNKGTTIQLICYYSETISSIFLQIYGLAEHCWPDRRFLFIPCKCLILNKLLHLHPLGLTTFYSWGRQNFHYCAQKWLFMSLSNAAGKEMSWTAIKIVFLNFRSVTNINFKTYRPNNLFLHSAGIIAYMLNVYFSKFFNIQRLSSATFIHTW